MEKKTRMVLGDREDFKKALKEEMAKPESERMEIIWNDIAKKKTAIELLEDMKYLEDSLNQKVILE